MNKLADFISLPPRFASDEEIARHEREIREAQELERKRERREAWAMVEASIPVVHSEAKLDAEWLRALVGPRAMRGAHAAIQAPRVVLMGPTSAGKSSLAVAMLRARKDLGARFVDCMRLGTARIQHRAGDGEAPAVEAAMLAKFALLDELGGERHTQNSAVGEVIHERHAQKRPTWFTTGQTPEELSARYGTGEVRRVFEGAVVIKLGGRK
jgi:DNA replication protein DnaC